MHLKPLLTVFGTLLFLAGCNDGELTTASPAPDPLLGAAIGAGSAVTVSGAPGFQFLPPMGSSQPSAGQFDPGLAPIVEICAAVDCETLHARFSMTEGAGSEVVRLSGEQYIVNWHTGQTGAAAGQTYRVRVLSGDVTLGHADVAVAATGREAVSLRQDGSIALIAGQTLPIKMWIATGIVGTVIVSPAEATIEAGATQPYSAEVRDLHGAPLAGPLITWSSEDDAVATVASDGLATGVGIGTVMVTASAGAMSGSALLTVTGSSEPPGATCSVADNFDSPLDLEVGQSFDGRICGDDPQNADYFRIQVPAGCVLSITLTLSHETSDLDLYLLDAAGNMLESSESSNDSEMILYAPGGEMELRVVVSNVGGQENTYTLLAACQE